jgi:hypothetical protein
MCGGGKCFYFVSEPAVKDFNKAFMRKESHIENKQRQKKTKTHVFPNQQQSHKMFPSNASSRLRQTVPSLGDRFSKIVGNPSDLPIE